LDEGNRAVDRAPKRQDWRAFRPFSKFLLILLKGFASFRADVTGTG